MKKELNKKVINKKLIIILCLVIILCLSILSFYLGYRKGHKKDNVELESSSILEGIWKDETKIPEIIGREDDKIITNDDGNPFYIVFDSKGNFTSLINGEIDKGNYSEFNENNEIFLEFATNAGTTCKLIDNNKLHCDKYAYFSKME